jgi:hypothetical protein
MSATRSRHRSRQRGRGCGGLATCAARWTAVHESRSAAARSEDGHSTRDACRAITKRRSRRKQGKVIDGQRTGRGTSTVHVQRDARGVGDLYDLHRSATRGADRDVHREHPHQRAINKVASAGRRAATSRRRSSAREHRVDQRKLPRQHITITIARASPSA